MRAKAARTATCALDLEVRWGETELLASEHLHAPVRYTLDSSPLRAEQHGFVVREDWLEAAPRTLVDVQADRAEVQHPDGRLQTLRLGEQTRVQVGPLVFRLTLVPPRALSARPSTFRPREHAWTAASLALHGLPLACMMGMPPTASSLSLDLMSEDTQYALYLTTPVERSDAQLPWTDAREVPSESQEGQRAKDSSGQAGKPDVAKSDRRLAVQGKSTTRELPRLTADNVQRAGLLGAIAAASMNLGPSTPYGADTPVGYDAASAVGALFGRQIGDDFGVGGLALIGKGRGGGGDGEGAVGLGELGTGTAARNALGATGVMGTRRKEHVPVLRVSDAEVRGSLSKEVIRRTIHRHLNEVRYCYEGALARDPQLQGRLAVMFVIAPSGAVQGVAVKESTLASRAVAECVTQAVRRFAFPAPDGGGYVQVTYPFSFSAD